MSDDLSARRAERQGRPPLVCFCGGQWFYVVSPEGDNAGQVTLDADGRVTGYRAMFVCAGCSREVAR